MTARSATWERAPFTRCPSCSADDAFGFLSAGGSEIRRRCTRCRHTVNDPLPALDKAVIYLDQFAFSELFKLNTGRRRQDKLTGFWQEVDHLVHRVMLLQQAVFPASDVHFGETVVSPWPSALREACRAISGDVSFHDTDTIQLMQVEVFAHAFISGQAPHVDFGVDRIIRGDRNAWLTDIRIAADIDQSFLAAVQRIQRAKTGQRVTALTEGWRRDSLGFEEVLEIELDSYRNSRTEALQAAVEQKLGPGFIDHELSLLHQVFNRSGIPKDQIEERIQQFWAWEGNREQPFGLILAYMFAGLAGQVKAGRKKEVSAGFVNDVRAVSAYAPFVDAMFVDKECATLLTQGRAARELQYRARIFSLNSRDDFLEYLSKLEAAATDAARHYASLIYGA